MTIRVEKNKITIVFSLWEKLVSLHGNFTIPRTNVTGISEGRPNDSWLDLRIPGMFLPGVIKAGTYYSRRGKEFWCVTFKHAYIYSIELQDMNYSRIVVGTTQQVRWDL